MKCSYHPDRDAVATCSKCGQPVCSDCTHVTGTHPICQSCWDKRVSPHQAGVSAKPVGTSKLVESTKPATEVKAKMKTARTVAIVLSVICFVFCFVILAGVGASMKFSNSMLAGLIVFGVTYGIGALIVKSTRK